LADTYVAIPLAAMVITDKVVQVDSPIGEINTAPKFTLAGLQQRYAAVTIGTPIVIAAPIQPMTVVTPAAESTTVVAVPSATVVAPVASPTVATPVAVPPEAVYLNRQHEMVGRSVVDTTGAQIGTVDYVAVSPTSGAARYVVVSGPLFGPDYGIFVPYSQARLQSGRVVVDTPMATLMQAQRFRRADLAQFYTIN
jgi:sporulation protein YlmC with PRC-barrel domain